jgi:hypothetical protein
LEELEGLTWLQQARGQGVERELVPMVQYILLYGLKTLFGSERMHALPEWLFSAAASMPVVGFNAHHGRHGVCQRGAAKRQGPRTAGPICPEALANNLVKLDLRALEALFNGAIRALSKAGRCRAKVTGIVDGTDLETTALYEGCGQVTRTRKRTDTHGQGREMEVTVYGWKVIVLIDATTKIPLAVTVVQIQEHEVLFLRAWVTQACTTLEGYARLSTVVVDHGFLAGTDVWWLDQHGITFVVPATEDMAVTADARALAAASDEIMVGRRAHTVRHGQGREAWSERLETEVVGIAGLTTYDHDGTLEHGRQHYRCDFQPNPIHAVVVRQWHGRDYGPGSQTVFLTNASVQQSLQPFDDDDERSLIENCCLKESQQQWSLRHPPQKTARAVRVHVVFTLLMFARATAYRLRCEALERGTEPVGWQRWRRQLLQQNRDKLIVFAQG